jgi:hypothetical protein
MNGWTLRKKALPILGTLLVGGAVAVHAAAYAGTQPPRAPKADAGLHHRGQQC